MSFTVSVAVIPKLVSLHDVPPSLLYEPALLVPSVLTAHRLPFATATNPLLAVLPVDVNPFPSVLTGTLSAPPTM